MLNSFPHLQTRIFLGIVVITFLLIPGLRSQETISLDEIASGFTIPVSIAHAGDERLFIVEKRGTIRIMDTSGNVHPDVFLDIDARVNSVSSERGLLGLAFHPNYADNGYFYVNYTNNSGTTVISRFSRDTLIADAADPDSEVMLLTVAQPFSNHNGGHLVFGPDGYLYIGLGDGGSAGDPGDRAQNRMNLLGKMLRIDVDNGDPYGIPQDNPFAEDDFTRDEIWALGLRNPWKYSFDRETGDFWIADVGQDNWEEISFQPAESPGGENYGWRCREGFVNFNTTDCPDASELTDPAYVYAHTGGGCSGSVTGGFVYRGSAYPDLYGKYVFTDYCTGVFRALERDQEGNVTDEVLADLQNQQFTAFGEDIFGELYVAAASGRIYRLKSLVSSTAQPTNTTYLLRPNPAGDAFRVSTVSDALLQVSIYDLSGRVLLTQRVVAHQEVNCRLLAEGMYIVSLQDGNVTWQSKLIIHR